MEIANYKIITMNKKFNRTSKRTAWFPITQHRYNTEKHPVITTDDKVTSHIEVKTARIERQIIEGLSNILQCPEREAIRIAIYELNKSDGTYATGFRDKARSGSEVDKYKTRSQSQRYYLTAAEKALVVELGKSFDMTTSEIVRLAINWLANAIRDGRVYHLTKSRKIGQAKLADDWRKEARKEGKQPTKLQPLKTANEKALFDAQQRASEKYDERGEWLNNHPQERKLLGEDCLDIGAIDTLMMLEEQDAIGLNDMNYQQLVEYYSCMFPEFTDEECQSMADSHNL